MKPTDLSPITVELTFEVDPDDKVWLSLGEYLIASCEWSHNGKISANIYMEANETKWFTEMSDAVGWLRERFTRGRHENRADVA